MRDLDAALNDLQILIGRRLAIQEDLATLSRSGLSAPLETSSVKNSNVKSAVTVSGAGAS
jgi:hypothetical protein